MSEPPKKRPWFQYHLSTAIILMFLWGGLLGINFAPQSVPPYKGVSKGWPLWVYRELEYSGREPFDSGFQTYQEFTDRIGFDSVSGDTGPSEPNDPKKMVDFVWRGKSTNLRHLAIDVCVAVAAMIIVACLLEWHIRRKDRQRKQCSSE